MKNYHFTPFILILSLPILIHSFTYGELRLYLASIATISIPILIRIIFNIRPFFFILLSLPVLFFTIMYNVMIIEYDSYINISTWNSIINSNLDESSELFSELRPTTKFLTVFQIITYLIYLFLTFKKSIPKTNKKRKNIAIVILCFLLVDFSVRGATRISFPARSFVSLYDYYKVKTEEMKYFETKKNAVFNAQRIDKSQENKKETIVVVVGETLRRDRLEYYGYKKETTPLMKNENLIIYTDVISPVNATVNSLKRVFTLAEELNEEGYRKYPSFIKSFKEVGFKTYWVSTQLIYDRYINEVSFIAQESDSIINKLPVNFDLTILKSYQDILKESEQKKLIIIHILGNHASYKKRYPKEFNFFAKEKSKDKRVNLLREYNNSVRYNDYVLHQFLSSLKQLEGEKSFIMFSDHGESLYDSSPTYCFHGSDKPAKSEFDIPFILWFCEEFKKNNLNLIQQVKNNRNKSIILSDFFHAFPSLHKIKFDKLKSENNFFDKNYVPKNNRKVINGSLQLLDYNKLDKIKQKIDY